MLLFSKLSKGIQIDCQKLIRQVFIGLGAALVLRLNIHQSFVAAFCGLRRLLCRLRLIILCSVALQFLFQSVDLSFLGRNLIARFHDTLILLPCLRLIDSRHNQEPHHRRPDDQSDDNIDNGKCHALFRILRLHWFNDRLVTKLIADGLLSFHIFLSGRPLFVHPVQLINISECNRICRIQPLGRP